MEEVVKRRRLASLFSVAALGGIASLAASPASAALLPATLDVSTSTVLPTGQGSSLPLASFSGNMGLLAPQTVQSYASLQAQIAAATLTQYITQTSDLPNGGGGIVANISFGIGVMNPNTGGASNIFNTAMGFGALNLSPSQPENTAIGAYALASLPTGSGGYFGGNTAIGYFAGINLTGAQTNTLVGSQAGQSLTTGYANVAMGHGAMTGQDFGLKVPATASLNVAIGTHALQDLETGNYNVVVGCGSGTYLTSGSGNVLLGLSIGGTNGNSNSTPDAFSLITGSYNTAAGHQAMRMVTAAVSFNCAFGFQSLQNDQIGRQCAFGYQSLCSSTTASDLSAFGYQAGYAITTGSNNSVFGYQGLFTCTTGTDNTAMGTQALRTYNGSDSTAIGFNALQAATAGNNNVALGSRAGFGTTTAQQSLTDLQMTFLGAGASRDPTLATTTVLSNATAVGYGATLLASNTVTLGNTSVRTVTVGGPSGASIQWGPAAPTVAPPGGAGIFIVSGGATGASLYNYSAGAWHAVA